MQRRGQTIKHVLLLIVFCAAMPASLLLGQGKPHTWIPTPEERAAQPWIPGTDEVLIGPGAVSMPLGKILLVRKGVQYCALKFIDTWLGETKHDHYTSYEFYYQGDGSGDFSGNKAVPGAGVLFFPRVRGFLGMPVIKEAKDIIECGDMKLKWRYIAHVGSKEVEYAFAPTPWNSITEVNVHDARIRWHSKAINQQIITVHIDQLWDKHRDGEGKKEK
ncbi:MAG: hypothetical protein HY880_01315 [Deltaproteobacteria bacterium]|nr:hypothetical protein [Deltaproteobacteria bacterium]